MEVYLYQDLYRFEERHWWHISKRDIVVKLITKYLESKKPLILDIGCGTGKNIEVFNKIGSCWGIDNSPEAIKLCHKRKLGNIKLASADHTKLPKGSFDLVTILDVLEHTDEDRTLSEINRILKPQGLLIITVPAYSWLWSKWDEALHHRRRYNINSLKQALVRHNYSIEKISYFYSFLLLPAIMIRLLKSIIFIKNYPSDFRFLPPLINTFAQVLSKAEMKILEKYGIPFGTSLICVAKKNA